MEIRHIAPHRPNHSPAIEVAWQGILNVIPAVAYTCDSTGLITYFNSLAQAVWGRAARLRDAGERYCGSYQLYLADGTPIRHEQCWMALALLEGKPYIGREIVIERPDRSRTFGEAHAHPLRDHRGQIIGAVNLVADITALRDPGADNAIPSSMAVPYDAALAMIEVAASVLAGIAWPTTTFN
jgi:PAS domain-containing protein